MKIHQLPEGARFEYEGEAYVKTGPMFATGPKGQRLIPKYAVLKPLDIPAVASDAAGMKSSAASRRALEAFAAECRPLLADGAGPAFNNALARLRAALRLLCWCAVPVLLMAAAGLPSPVAAATGKPAVAAKATHKKGASVQKKARTQKLAKARGATVSKSRRAPPKSTAAARTTPPAAATSRVARQAHPLPAQARPTRAAPLVAAPAPAAAPVDAAREGREVCRAGDRVYLMADCGRLGPGEREAAGSSR